MRYELYRIVFSNGKMYFGISKDHSKRFREHLNNAIRRNSRLPIHAAIRKYPANMRLELLVVGEINYIKELEIKAIASFSTTDRQFGYNVSFGGDTSPMHNPEIAARVSASKKGISTEKMQQVARARIGTKQSDGTRRKNSQSHKDFWAGLDDKQRTKILVGLKGRPAWNKGVKYADDSKILESIRSSARNRGPEWRKNVTKANQNSVFTPARRAQLAAARANRDLSAEATALGVKTKGTVWITNGIKSRRVQPNYLLPNGWRYGKTHSKRTH